MKSKLLDLCNLYEKINDGASNRGNHLEETLEVADRFWDDLHNLSRTLKDLQDTLANQEPPALEPSLIREQQDTLEVILRETSVNADVDDNVFVLVDSEYRLLNLDTVLKNVK